MDATLSEGPMLLQLAPCTALNEVHAQHASRNDGTKYVLLKAHAIPLLTKSFRAPKHQCADDG
jgi:hypothetical protein